MSLPPSQVVGLVPVCLTCLLFCSAGTSGAQVKKGRMEVSTVLLLMIIATVVYNVYKWYLERERIDKITDKSVLITGCDTGFGFELAQRLDGLGFRVFAACLTEDGVGSVRAACSERTVPIIMDVSQHDSVQNCFQIVKTAVGQGGLWGVVNNAGVVGGGMPVAELCLLDDYRQALDINLIGTVDVSLTFLPLLKRCRGRLVNVSSCMGRFATRLGPYCTSKFAIEGFSDSLRRSLPKLFGVSVHLIEPGGYKTRFGDENRARTAFMNAWKRLPAELQDEYGDEYREQVSEGLIDSFQSLASSKTHEVIDAMEHALCAANPRSRYVVGLDAMLLLIPLSWLPTSLADALFCNAKKPPVPAALKKSH
ncbi:retinol dehydrogenase 16-like isoform X1 [Branchiostoma floridae]|uniref:Retinol dehydrogenase 16-like isoform X1 n=2 Tax=Branchiostoma floridae TaxID=7739 RepID=A0A9J7KWE1_BRAFL|nr:retinol dehydrogenase 16-like isoform X1 [Branchiostoma floridae]